MEQVLTNSLIAGDHPRRTPWIVTWLTWPLILVGGVGSVAAAMSMGGNVGPVSGAAEGASILPLDRHVISLALGHRWLLSSRFVFLLVSLEFNTRLRTIT